MTRALETRLRKLEADSPGRKTRLFVIDGWTVAERQACIDDLIRSGTARPSDSFVHTGVPRNGSGPRATGAGPVDELMDRVASEGRKVHDPLD